MGELRPVRPRALRYQPMNSPARCIRVPSAARVILVSDYRRAIIAHNQEARLPRIFVSYRREDGAASAGRLGDRLAREFGGDRVFMDVDSIPLGTDFVKRLADEVQACDALLVVIGPQWIDIRDENGDRRLDDPNDFVRVEIRAALKRNIPVIPILLDGTKIPKGNLLPEDIRPLAVRNALDLRHNSFQKDLDRLIREVGVVFPEAMRASENDGARTIVRPIRWIVGALLVLFGVSIFLFLYRPWVTVA